MSKIDDEFKARAKAAEAAELEKNANKGKSFNKNYETIKWTGLVSGQMKIIRAIGDHPDFRVGGITEPQRGPFDARVVRIARILDDKGKRMRVVLPLLEDDENFILWRIINRVNEFEWVDKKRVFVNQLKHPEIFNIVNFNGLPETNNGRKFGLEGKGWEGREVFIMNVLDRSLTDWMSQNKHTVLLSKNITPATSKKDGSEIEFVEEGVPAYGFTQRLVSLIKTYGFWENFDIGIERTGTTTEPYKLSNLSRTPEVAPEDLQKLINSNPGLTNQELGYAKYDLDKLFRVTSYSKIWNKLHVTIAQIDATLGTHYSDELKALAEEEKAKFAESDKDSDENEDTEEAFSDNAEPEPVRAMPAPVASAPVSATVATGSTAGSFVKPPAYDKLSQSEKDLIASSEPPMAGETAWHITYKGGGKLVRCPNKECQCKTPEVFTMCPQCGMTYTF